jgi:transcriptional regulator with XRE-family HTH domain
MDLKQRAKDRGLKQKEIAADLGVSEGTISKWLNRDAVIPTAYLRPLAEALETPIEALLPLEAA